MLTPDEKLELAKQWSWLQRKVASGDWPSGEEVRSMAPLVYEWLRRATTPPLDLPEEKASQKGPFLIHNPDFPTYPGSAPQRKIRDIH